MTEQIAWAVAWLIAMALLLTVPCVDRFMQRASRFIRVTREMKRRGKRR